MHPDPLERSRFREGLQPRATPNANMLASFLTTVTPLDFPHIASLKPHCPHRSLWVTSTTSGQLIIRTVTPVCRGIPVWHDQLTSPTKVYGGRACTRVSSSRLLLAVSSACYWRLKSSHRSRYCTHMSAGHPERPWPREPMHAFTTW